MFKADDYRLRLKSLSETLAEAKYALDIDNLGGKLQLLLNFADFFHFQLLA